MIKKPKKKIGNKKVVKAKIKVSKSPKPIGVITHYYTAIKVGIFKFNKPIKKGVKIEVRGATTNFSEKIGGMQYDHKPIAIAPKGKQVGIKLKKRVRVGDKVYPVK